MKKTALLVIDVQEGIFQLPAPLYNGEKFLDNVESLLEKARAADIPVIYLQHCGSKGSTLEMETPGWPIHSRLIPKEGDVLIRKSEPDSFSGTQLEQVLRSRGIEALYICGFSTNFCVDTTVRSAYARQFKLVLVSDAHTTTKNEILDGEQTIRYHNWALTRFAILQSTAQVSF